MIQAQIRKDFQGFSLDLAFQAALGVTALFGPSGAGKTLTLDSIAGFVRPDHGRILLDGRLLFDSASRLHLPPRARQIGYVFQNYALFPHMTLQQNLEFAAQSLPPRDRARRVLEMLDRFRLSDLASRRPHQLSGGQRQRCSIARALITAPKLLLLDEPARGLDAPLRAELYQILRQVQTDFQTPALLVTHDLDECFQIADQMLIVHAGRLAQSGSPRSILEQPANLDVARLLGRFNLMSVTILALDAARGSSLLRFENSDLSGPYLPGRSIGERAWLCTRPESLRAFPRESTPGHNQIPATLLRVVELPAARRLEFSPGFAVEVHPGAAPMHPPKEWSVEFPPRSLKIF